ncbi:sensor domain-containing protein [Halorarius halobius]|uniref:sensor domain-containing protein n=1 Tax=Halorarius halobius TaxID=2962671 RepID=UPI0020CBE6A4|nr:sensor domain-containing protein [Halorarius halobius]
MSEVLARLRSSVPRPSLRSVATAPVRPRTYGNLAYLALSFPLGIAYFVVVVVGLSLSVGLAILLVGVALFVGLLATTVGLVTVERRLTGALVGVDIEAPDWKFRDGDDLREQVTGLLLDPAVWLGLVYLATKLAVGIAAFTLLMVLLVPAVVLVATPLFYDQPGVTVGLFLPTDVSRELSLYVPWNELLVGVSFVVRLTSWQVTTLADAVAMSALGVVALVVALNLLNGAAWLCGQWARLLVGGTLTRRVDGTLARYVG